MFFGLFSSRLYGEIVIALFAVVFVSLEPHWTNVVHIVRWRVKCAFTSTSVYHSKYETINIFATTICRFVVRSFLFCVWGRTCTPNKPKFKHKILPFLRSVCFGKTVSNSCAFGRNNQYYINNFLCLTFIFIHLTFECIVGEGDREKAQHLTTKYDVSDYFTFFLPCSRNYT